MVVVYLSLTSQVDRPCGYLPLHAVHTTQWCSDQVGEIRAIYIFKGRESLYKKKNHLVLNQ